MSGKPGLAQYCPQNSLHLHARELVLPHPSGRGELRIKAELPPHMAATWRHFGFPADTNADPFADIE